MPKGPLLLSFRGSVDDFEMAHKACWVLVLGAESPVDQKAPLIVDFLVLIFYIFNLFLRTSQSSMHAIVVVIYFAMIEDWDIALVFKDYFLL